MFAVLLTSNYERKCLLRGARGLSWRTPRDSSGMGVVRMERSADKSIGIGSMMMPPG